MDIFIYLNNSVKYPYLYVRENISDLPRFIQLERSRTGPTPGLEMPRFIIFAYFIFPPNFDIYATDGSLSKMSKLNSHLLYTIKFWKRWEYQTTWPASWETYMQLRKQQLELDMDNRLVPNRKRSTSRLYIVTQLIQLLCRVHHEKCWAGRSIIWNQDFWEKYQ